MMEIKRRAESFIAARLTERVSNHRFIPYKGASDPQDDERDLEPPFTVVGVTTATQQFCHSGVWKCEGRLQIISHESECRADTHASLVARIRSALARIEPASEDGFIFHGIDITATSSGSDEENSVWADIIDFSIGCSG